MRVEMVLVAGLIAAVPSMASATIRVTGGTPAQQQVLRDAVAQLPSCMTKLMEDKDVVVREAPDGDAGLTFRPDGSWAVDVNLDVLGTEDQRAKALGESCVPRSEWEDTTVPQIVLHEVAHVYFHANKEAMSTFIQIAYAKKYERYTNDARVQEILKNARKMALEKGEVPDDEACKIKVALQKIQVEYGLVNRNPGDIHSLDSGLDEDANPAFADLEEGANEYFAMLIELYAKNGAKFCQGLTPAEAQWFATHLGDCLREIEGVTPPACLEPATPVARRPDASFLRP